MSFAHSRFRWYLALTCSIGLCLLIPGSSHSKPDEDLQDDEVIQPDGIHVLDGSYVLDVGEFQINITNHGLIGSQFTNNLPYSSSPSGEWPGGSGHEYLWGAGLWVGGRVNGEPAVSTGQPEREFRPGRGILDTIYEAKNGKVIRPTPNDVATGNRLPHPQADDDGDQKYDEDFLNGFDDDGDGQVDEDFGQLGDQMFTCTMHDNTALSQEIYPEHKPLDISVVQRAATWYREDLENIVILDFEVHNNGYRTLDDIYLGFYADCDIQRRDDTTTGSDDLAGFYKAAVRSSDGAFQRIQLAWMHDAARYNPLPGWIGAILLEHKNDFSGITAPRQTEVRSFQIFATNARVNQNGEPKTDADRYELMARNQIDPDRRPDQPGDLKYMFSSGPFNYVKPGEKLIYRVALVMGNSKAEMIANAVKATELVRGHWFNLDNNWWTGRGGRETKICLGDLPKGPGEQDPIYNYRAIMPNEVCAGSHPRLFISHITKADLTPQPDGRYCIFINADNCEECYRAVGQDCIWPDELYDNMGSYMRRDLYPYAQIFTGYGGREARLPWIGNEERPPHPPSMRLVPGQFHVDIYWDDSSEHEPDFLRDVIDFESYQVWRVNNWRRPPGTDIDLPPRSDLWSMITEYDVANFVPAGAGFSPNELPLGNNTGLDAVVYVPVSFTDPAFTGLAEAMQEFVDADTEGKFTTRPPLRTNRGVVIPGMEGLIPWESRPAVLDTFFALTAREEAAGVRPKRATRYYRHRDIEVHDGFPTYYSVVASDHALTVHENRYVPSGPGITTEPGNNFQKTIPESPGQTVEEMSQSGMNIYVFPNPATREALAQFQQQPPSAEDPTGDRIMFNNLPASQVQISIFTASGDLVQTIDHDGINEGGGVTWNLMSRNGQEVVSGIYLYSVKADNNQFEDFHGRFVLVR